MAKRKAPCNIVSLNRETYTLTTREPLWPVVLQFCGGIVVAVAFVALVAYSWGAIS